jgi:hypothetical protein
LWLKYNNFLVDMGRQSVYNEHMNKTNELLQWAGAGFIVAGHSLNAIGPAVYPWNIVTFSIGTIAFLAWAIRVANKPQAMVNIVSLAIGLVGLYKAFG